MAGLKRHANKGVTSVEFACPVVGHSAVWFATRADTYTQMCCCICCPISLQLSTTPKHAHQCAQVPDKDNTFITTWECPSREEALIACHALKCTGVTMVPDHTSSTLGYWAIKLWQNLWTIAGILTALVTFFVFILPAALKRMRQPLNSTWRNLRTWMRGARQAAA